MKADARFEDAEEKPLRLLAQDPDDLTVLSSLVQDAVLPMDKVQWQPKLRRLSLLINRFRWEYKEQAERTHTDFERVRSMLVIDDVLKVSSFGIDRHDPDQILSILSLSFDPKPDGAGSLVLTLAGDGAISAEVECLDITLADVTRPYKAVSRSAPVHDPK